MMVYDWVAAVSLGMIAAISVVMLLQYFKLRDLWDGFKRCREAMRWAQIFESENRELKRSLRAEQRLTAQLQAQVAKLQACGAPRENA